MNVQLGKFFIVAILAIALAVGGLTWLSSQSLQAKANHENALPNQVAQLSTARDSNSSSAPSQAAEDSTQRTTTTRGSSFEEGYRTGYRDGQRDCAESRAAAAGTTRFGRPARYTARRGVAGERYYAEPRRGHSTRNLILTIAAPAALGAGIGAIAGGKKGAGAGALIGGGGGALYYLIKNRRR